MSTDRIEKQILLRAPLGRVWRAISDSKEFGTWFGMQVEGPFVHGTSVKAVIRPTEMDPKVAEAQKSYEGVRFDLRNLEVEPPRRFAFRWKPYEGEGGDSTLVEFVLEEKPEGVLLKITESGFDNVPLDKRAKAFAQNEQGWIEQTRLIEAYLAKYPE